MTFHRFNLRSLAALILVFAAGACALNPFGGGGSDEDDVSEGEQRVSFLSFDQTLEVDPELAARGVSVPPSAINSAWRMEGGSANNVVGHPKLSETPRRVWRRDSGAGSNSDRRVTAPPVVENNRLFVMDARGQVTAYDAQSGRKLWDETLRADARRDRQARAGGVAVFGDQVFVTTGFGVIVSLNAQTGDEIWRRRVGAPIHSPPSVDNGRVFAVSVDNELFALSAEDGDVLWTYQSLAEPARILSASSPAVSGEVVVAPFASGEVVALRVDNGRPLWSEALTSSVRTTPLSSLNDIAGSPIILNDVVYAVSHSGVMAALDLRSGERIWTQPAGGIHRPWVVGPYLFVVTTEAELVAMSRFNGRIHWISQLPLYRNEKKRKGKIAWAGPVLAGGQLYLTTSDGRLLAVSVTDGGKIESYSLGAPTFIPPIVANETLYVLDDDGKLSAFR